MTNIFRLGRSEIRLESANYNGKLDIKDYVIEQLYADIIFAEYLDEADGAIESNGLFKVDLKSKVWRKAIVRVVSPWVMQNGTTKPRRYYSFSK